MKRLCLLVILVLSVPFTCLGMELLTDQKLEDISGQAGVTIGFLKGDTTVSFSIDGLAWGDGDGIAGPGDAGHIRLEGPLSIIATIHEGENLTIDVSSTDGIVIGLPKIDIQWNSPPVTRISLGAGEKVANWSSPPPTNEIFGYLGFNNAINKFLTPEVIALKPH